METMKKLMERFNSFRHKIDQLSLDSWLNLAKRLDVANNDRNQAAKKLAIRSLKKEG